MHYTMDTLLRAIGDTKCPPPASISHGFETWVSWYGDDCALAALALLRWRNGNGWRPAIYSDDFDIVAEWDEGEPRLEMALRVSEAEGWTVEKIREELGR